MSQQTVSKLKKEIDELQAQLFYNINELTDKSIALNAANAKIADLQQQNDGLVSELQAAEKTVEKLEEQHQEMCNDLSYANGAKDDAEEIADEKDRVLQVALRAFNVTERELLMVENSARPKEILLSMVA